MLREKVSAKAGPGRTGLWIGILAYRWMALAWMTLLAATTGAFRSGLLAGILIVLVGILFLVAPLILIGFGLPLAFGLAASVLGGIIFIFGLIWIGVGVGLLHLRSWAWWLAIIVMILSIVGSIAVPVAAIIPGLILIYLILVRRQFH